MFVRLRFALLCGRAQFCANGTVHWHTVQPARAFSVENLAIVNFAGKEAVYCVLLSYGLNPVTLLRAHVCHAHISSCFLRMLIMRFLFLKLHACISSIDVAHTVKSLKYPNSKDHLSAVCYATLQ